MLTFLSLDEIERLEAQMQSEGYKPNTAQTILAREVTRFVHGVEGLKQAESATQVELLSRLVSYMRLMCILWHKQLHISFDRTCAAGQTSRELLLSKQ